MILGLLASLSFGRDNLPEMWVQLHEGRLVHLVEREPSEAIEIFEALLSGLSNQHPLYGELMFSLGCAQYDSDQSKEAQRSFLLSSQSAHAPPEALDFLMEVSAQKTAVTTLPYVGTPWVSLHEKKGRSKLYKANVEAERVRSIEIDIRLDTPSTVTVSMEGWSEKVWSETKTYESGPHTLVFDHLQLVVDKNPLSIRSIEVEVEKEDVLTVSTLSVK